MKAGIIAVAAMVGMGGLATEVRADTGNQMAENCRAFLKEKIPSDRYFNAGVCAGFVNGVTDTLVLARIASPETIAICIPREGFTMGQAAKVLLKYFDDHPESLHENASMLAIQAYKAAYPCK
ncbi:hypothetical protein HX819_27700 [Pseudomonas sp. D6002]|uniref:Rap1a/Tai family immunity protein n=1 Tax=unclassified Pseudomonas TaxID=196821 RepID=UPI0015A213D0|nr:MULTISPECIES: Rap1a/Tai family immunity protein [unclassified Pseudomonas]MBK5436655.1 hypothetical protein [Pseudomonas sp. TH32]NVZ95103.1 hypothetical protein [Pseudomonas sp. B6001]NWB18236.1 hypothetical protein [Pseudomonas sp. D6002]